MTTTGDPEGETNEYQRSLLESLPQQVTHSELKAANERQWRSGVIPMNDQCEEPEEYEEPEVLATDQPERMPGLPKKPGLRMPSFGGVR
jgi:hypothetical protein